MRRSQTTTILVSLWPPACTNMMKNYTEMYFNERVFVRNILFHYNATTTRRRKVSTAAEYFVNQAIFIHIKKYHKKCHGLQWFVKLIVRLSIVLQLMTCYPLQYLEYRGLRNRTGVIPSCYARLSCTALPRSENRKVDRLCQLRLALRWCHQSVRLIVCRGGVCFQTLINRLVVLCHTWIVRLLSRCMQRRIADASRTKAKQAVQSGTSFEFIFALWIDMLIFRRFLMRLWAFNWEI